MRPILGKDFICRNCDKWDSDTGECRNSAPMIDYNSGRAFPETHPNDWCGEYTPSFEMQEMLNKIAELSLDSKEDEPIDPLPINHHKIN